MILFSTPLDQAQIDFENEGGEIYVCGNPPYRGSNWQTAEQKADLTSIFQGRTRNWKSLDYVAGWFMKAADYGAATGASSALVSTNSICQGQQVQFLWPLIFGVGQRITFAHTSVKWSNLASHKAGVTVVIVGLAEESRTASLFVEGEDGSTVRREVNHINAYLIPERDVIVGKAMAPLTDVSPMDFGNKADDGGHLTLSTNEVEELHLSSDQRKQFVRRFWGSSELINGGSRYCLWIEDAKREEAERIPSIAKRIESVLQSNG